MALAELLSSFTLGLLTPLTAACVLPLYPGFIAYLSKQFSGEESRKTYALFGLLVVLGVMSFMLLLGIVFSTLLQRSLTGVIEIVSPVAFLLLGLISIGLILDIEFWNRLPSYQGPRSDNPLLNAFGFGFFFGAIIIPCNPAFIAAFFARAFLFQSPVFSVFNFVLFGLGIGFPLLVFSLISSSWSKKIVQTLTMHQTRINRVTGLIMFAVAFYYLFGVFDIFGLHLVPTETLEFLPGTGIE